LFFVFYKCFLTSTHFCRSVFSRISSPWNDTTPSVGTKIVLWRYYPPIWFLFTHHRNNRILGNFFLSKFRRAETEYRAILVKEFYCNLLPINCCQYWDSLRKIYILLKIFLKIIIRNNYLYCCLFLNIIFNEGPLHDSTLTVAKVSDDFCNSLIFRYKLLAKKKMMFA